MPVTLLIPSISESSEIEKVTLSHYLQSVLIFETVSNTILRYYKSIAEYKHLGILLKIFLRTVLKTELWISTLESSEIIEVILLEISKRNWYVTTQINFWMAREKIFTRNRIFERMGDAPQFLKADLCSAIVRATHARASLTHSAPDVSRVYSYVAGINQSPVSSCTWFFLFTNCRTHEVNGSERKERKRESETYFGGCTSYRRCSEWIVKRRVINFEPCANRWGACKSRRTVLQKRIIVNQGVYVYYKSV